VLIASDDDMELLDDDESLLIKYESPPLIGIDINMVFTLPIKFGALRRRSLKCALVPRRSCLRSLRSLASI
jgi:hypothetical protein